MHFLYFEITVNRNTAPKIITGLWSSAKRVKMAEKPQKIGKEACQKDWLKQKMEEFNKPGEWRLSIDLYLFHFSLMSVYFTTITSLFCNSLVIYNGGKSLVP